MGSKFWQRKTHEVEAVILQYSPDVFIISEANMLNSLHDHCKDIIGYSRIVPLTTQVHKIARLVLLVRNGVRVEVQEKYMDNQLAAVWLKIGARCRRPLFLSGMYREHRYLFQNDETSATDRSQLLRWTRFVYTILVGDTNVDYLRWNLPEPSKTKLVVSNSTKRILYNMKTL